MRKLNAPLRVSKSTGWIFVNKPTIRGQGLDFNHADARPAIAQPRQVLSIGTSAYSLPVARL